MPKSTLPCSVDGCDKTTRSMTSDLCETCYSRVIRGGSRELVTMWCIYCDEVIPYSGKGTRTLRCCRGDECRRQWVADRNARYRERNPDASAAAQRRYREANQHKSRALHLHRAYGMTVDQYDRMAEQQGHVCVICSGPPVGHARLVVDHCHNSGEVRGLLCSPCNQMLGIAKDDPSTLLRAVDYLNAHAAIPAA